MNKTATVYRAFLPEHWPTVDERRQFLSVVAPIHSGLQILRGEGIYYGLGFEQPHIDAGYSIAGGTARRTSR